MNRLTGLIAAVATPLDATGAIDLPQLVAHCERLLRLGCDGLNLLGTTGEATSFSVEQRLTAMQDDRARPVCRWIASWSGPARRRWRTHLDSRAPPWSSAMRARWCCRRFITRDWMLIRSPDISARCSTSVGAADSRIYLYNFPQNSGVPFALEIVDRLVGEFPGVIRGLKDSSGDLLYATALAKRLPGFDVFPSAEGSVGHATEFGFAGCISATLNVTAPIMAPAWAKRGTPAAEAPIEMATAIRVALSQLPLVAAVKWAIGDLLGDPGWQRLAPPLRALTAAEADQLESALRATEFDLLRPHFAGPNSSVSIA